MTWDGDHDLDLAVANSGASNVVILENNGAGTFSIAATIPGLTSAGALAAGDWNADGTIDLAVTIANNVVILSNPP